MDYPKILKNILTSECYLSLATVDPDNLPWISPLAYIYDGSRKLYFISSIHSFHAKNIELQPCVSFSIFNTKQVPGNAFGVQGKGQAKKIKPSEMPDGLGEKLREQVSIIILSTEHSFYEVEISEIYLPDENRWKLEGNIRKPIDIHLLTVL